MKSIEKRLTGYVYELYVASIVIALYGENVVTLSYAGGPRKVTNYHAPLSSTEILR